MKKNIFWKILIIIFSIILIIGIYLLINELSNKNPLLKVYPKNVVNYIEKNNLNNELIEKPYSKTLEIAINNNLCKNEFVDYYLKIEYKDRINFINEINTLLIKDYSFNEVNSIYQKYLKSIDILLQIDKIDLSHLDISNIDLNNYSRYLSFQKKEDINFSDVVTKVNIGLDNEFYSNLNNITNPQDNLVLVNKYNKLSDDYIPDDIVELSGTIKISQRAKESIVSMVSAATEAGHYVCYYSGYRSFETQEKLYDRYVARDGAKEADLYSARPGHSEHQTGLAIDLCTTGRVTIKDGTALFEWIEENAHNYGFIIRYPKGKTDITGYQFEPWHLRFIGIEHATKVNNLKITYDEYYDLFIKER